jgi:shikimate kinase
LRALAAAPPARAVIATGGGIVESEAAAALLRALGPVVWLRADPDAALQRLDAAARAARPLLAGGAWRGRWAQRQSRYAALADHVVSTHPESVETSLAALAGALGWTPG